MEQLLETATKKLVHSKALGAYIGSVDRQPTVHIVRGSNAVQAGHIEQILEAKERILITSGPPVSRAEIGGLSSDRAVIVSVVPCDQHMEAILTHTSPLRQIVKRSDDAEFVIHEAPPYGRETPSTSLGLEIDRVESNPVTAEIGNIAGLQTVLDLRQSLPRDVEGGSDALPWLTLNGPTSPCGVAAGMFRFATAETYLIREMIWDCCYSHIGHEDNALPQSERCDWQNGWFASIGYSHFPIRNTVLRDTTPELDTAQRITCAARKVKPDAVTAQVTTKSEETEACFPRIPAGDCCEGISLQRSPL